MPTVIIYNNATNKVIAIGQNVISIASDFQKVTGEGWEWEGLTLDEATLIVSENVPTELKQSDELPNNLIDIKEQFIEQAQTNYEQRLADLELMLVEILST